MDPRFTLETIQRFGEEVIPEIKRLTPETVARLREVVEKRKVAGELRGGDPSARRRDSAVRSAASIT